MNNELYDSNQQIVAQSSPSLQCSDLVLDLSQPRIMGILNVAPDSFYDGGKYLTKEAALKRVAEMILEGADIIDIGAESSRPESQPLSQQEELDRLLPLLTAIKERFDILISVDTYKPHVMREAIKLGVHIINDIYALQQPGAQDAIATSKVAVCLMHMQNTPQTMQTAPSYRNVQEEVCDFLVARVNECLKNGIGKNRIVIDPGFGFGKSTSHNLQLLNNLSHLTKIGLPILVGLSRKWSIGQILSLPEEERLYGSLAAHVISVMKGASIVRTHDIKPTADALKIAKATLQEAHSCQ